MTFLAPWLAGIAAAIAVPTLVILYFLKLRRRDLEISSTLLWKKSIQDMQANAPFQRLRRNILLLLQLLVLAAALLAIAQPQWRTEAPPGQKHIILVDRSASMSSLDGGEAGAAPVSRLDAAKEQARELVRSLREPGLFNREGGDEAMVIAFDTGAEVRQTFTADKNVLLAAIDAITPTDAPTAGRDAFKLAAAHAPKRLFVDRDGSTRIIEGMTAGSIGTVHLFSDGRMADAGEIAPGREDAVIYHAVGKAESVNVGIVALRADRAFDDPTKLTVFVGLQSTDPAARSVDVELQIDGQVAGIKSATLPAATVTAGVDGGAAGAGSGPGSGPGSAPGPAPGAGGRTTPKPTRVPGRGGVTFSLQRPQGGVVSVRLASPAGRTAEDVLPRDDTAWLAVPPAQRSTIAVVSARGVLPFAAALEKLPLARLDEITPDEYEKRRREGKADYDVVILDNWLPAVEADAAREDGPSLPAGRYLIFGAVPAPPFGMKDLGKSGPTFIMDWQRSHPVLRGLSLDSLFIGAGRGVEIGPGSAAKVLATAESGPAIVELAGADVRAIVVPFDAAETNWPFELSFVIFVGSAVGYLGDDSGGSGLAQMIQPGGVLHDRLPRGAAEVRLTAPDGAESPVVPEADGAVTAGPIRERGVYRVTWSGPRGARDEAAGGRSARVFTANLLDPEESDVAVQPVLETASRVVTSRPTENQTVLRTVWPWLLLGALGVLMVEWFVYNRKVHL